MNVHPSPELRDFAAVWPEAPRLSSRVYINPIRLTLSCGAKWILADLIFGNRLTEAYRKVTMRSSDVDILMIPGLGDSGPDHWQMRWQIKLSTARRVDQKDWETPRRDNWVANIVAAVEGTERPVVIIAHSLGCIAVAHAAPLFEPGRVRGALLVAPVSARWIRSKPSIDPAFTPIPIDPLPFPSLLVASRTDEHATFEEAEEIAGLWGSLLLDAGDAGHLNADSGHGPWPEGLIRFAAFLARL